MITRRISVRSNDLPDDFFLSGRQLKLALSLDRGRASALDQAPSITAADIAIQRGKIDVAAAASGGSGVILYERRGGDITVNTETGGNQNDARIATLDGGGFVIVWSSSPSPDQWDIKGQRFDSLGNKVGGEFLVNQVAGVQAQPRVAALEEGRFVVTWANWNGEDGDGPGSGIKGQVFNADGSLSGTELLVNTTQPEFQFLPSIAPLAGGGFAIAWADASGLGGDPNLSIKMQLFDAAGMKLGGETLVNTETAGSQSGPFVAALQSGFVIAWHGGGAVHFQKFDDAGAPVGSETAVSTTPAELFNTPAVSAVGSGFVVVWGHSQGVGAADGFDISGQLFDAAGAKIGGEFQVHAAREGDQRVPYVHEVPGGGFLVTWQSPLPDSATDEAWGQFFTANGDKIGPEFVINSWLGGNQTGVRFIVLESGDIVVTWSDDSQAGGDFSGMGVKIQILTPTTDPPTDIALSNATLSETAFDNVPVATLSATGALNTSFSYTIVSDSTGGAFRIEGDRLVVADNNRLDFETDPDPEVRIRASDLNGNSYEETIQLTLFDSAIEARYAAGDEFRVNLDPAGLNRPLEVMALASDRVLILTSYFVDGPNSGMRGRIYDDAGAPLGAEFEVELPDGRSGLAVAALPSGGFVIAYEAGSIEIGPGTNGFPIRAQMFDAEGDPAGDAFLVSTNNQGNLGGPSVAVLESGNFIITWTRPQDEPGGSGEPFASQIAAQMFDQAGNRIDGEFRINTGIEGGQGLSQVVALSDGGFVVAWREFLSGSERIEAQIFAADGAKVGGDLTLHSLTLTGDYQLNGYELTLLESGRLLVSWMQRFIEGPPDAFELRARFMEADGSLGEPFYLMVATLGAEYEIAALPGGGFVMVTATLDHFDPALDDVQTGALIFNAIGERVNEGFFVPESTLDDEDGPHVAALASGDIVFAWSRNFVENGAATNDAYARLFALKPPPQIFGTTDADFLAGTSLGDVILGFAGNDRLQGFGGADWLDGGPGGDVLVGGAGADTFVFAAPAESLGHPPRSDGKKSMPDMIADFETGVDRIDLSAIDAIDGTPANDAFTFIGTAAFTGQAGQLRYDQDGGQVRIFADVDGDAFADFEIVAATPILQATDFVL